LWFLILWFLSLVRLGPPISPNQHRRTQTQQTRNLENWEHNMFPFASMNWGKARI
jgi:hypothetical protein